MEYIRRTLGHHKRQNVYICKKGKVTQVKGMENVLNEIVEENFLNLRKEMSVKIQVVYRTLNKQNWKTNSTYHIIVPEELRPMFYKLLKTTYGGLDYYT